jgi:hypothetical protein
MNGIAPTVAAGAAQAGRVQGIDQEVVAGTFVEEVKQGEVHGLVSGHFTERGLGGLQPF